MEESVQDRPTCGDGVACRFKANNEGNENSSILSSLQEILSKRLLTPIFQPIIAMGTGEIIGYEGLIRGPSDSSLHSPVNLFKAANQCGLSLEIERLCRQVTLQRFIELALPGKLFLNVSPECLTQPNFKSGETLGFLEAIGLSPERVIIELTENQPTYDYSVLREAAFHYRSIGFEIGIDDLGEGFSSLRLWSELRPEYIKIDMHFIQGINRDPVKLQFVRSIQQIADNSGSHVIAEGIETGGELMTVRDIGIQCGQGYFIGRPNAIPALAISAESAKMLETPGIIVYPYNVDGTNRVTAKKLLRETPMVSPRTQNDMIYDMFESDPTLHAVPVVKDDNLPIGLISRHMLIDRFARPYRRELYGRKPCTMFMDPSPLVVEKDISIQDLSHVIVEAGRHYLADGFIITDGGYYAGIGTGHDLMREITQLQINAARYANPLTMLPGNVPIYEHIDRLLHSQIEFCACYCDLDHFKPYNDVYGYRKGDDIIQMTGRILSEIGDPERDFIGHIGGDDFICLFQSKDWEERCRLALKRFSETIPTYFRAQHLAQQGYFSENRQGKKTFHPVISLSIGAVVIQPGIFFSHQAISSVTAEAKKQAKRESGNSLFIERRSLKPLSPFGEL